MVKSMEFAGSADATEINAPCELRKSAHGLIRV